MKKQSAKANPHQSAANTLSPIQAPALLLLLAYLLVTVLTPRFGTYDSNAPKFLALSLLNILGFLYLLLSVKSNGAPGSGLGFFQSWIGRSYTFLMIIILISFTQAINIPESILSFAKYFTVFCSAFILSILLRSHKKYFRILVIVSTAMLSFDCFTVFYHITKYIVGQVETISDIKSVYSNKNILASAIFIKIPFALWLFTFEKGLLKKFGYFSLFISFLATFYMSTRTFYLGLAFLAIVYCTLTIILDLKNKRIIRVGRPVLFLFALFLAFLLYNLTQKYLYPKNGDAYNVTIGERISTISAEEDSGSARLESWKRSAILFKQNPILGVGTGNWKIKVLEYENPVKSDFIYMLKNHNDFIEITTETGVFGGLAFAFLFILLFINSIKAYLKRQEIESPFKYLFLPAFGMFCYSFDAFFNFPADRAELQSLFAFFIGAGIAYSPGMSQNGNVAMNWKPKLIVLLLVVLQIPLSYVHQVNTISLKLQLFAQKDGILGRLTYPSQIFIAGYPTLLNVSSVAEPIAVIKSRYLIKEAKYTEAIALLIPDKCSPYDSRREYLLAKSFSMLGQTDSAMKYALIANKLKPLFYDPLGFICFTLKSSGKEEDATKMLENFLEREKLNKEAWFDLVTIYQEAGNYKNAIQSIDSAINYLPLDSTLKIKQVELSKYLKVIEYQETFNSGMKYYNLKLYDKALLLFNAILNKERGIAIVLARRAVCYFNMGEYQNCINDINQSIAGGYDTPDLINIRGACYHKLGKKAEACKDFEDASKRGDKDAEINSRRLCKGND